MVCAPWGCHRVRPAGGPHAGLSQALPPSAPPPQPSPRPQGWEADCQQTNAEMRMVTQDGLGFAGRGTALWPLRLPEPARWGGGPAGDPTGPALRLGVWVRPCRPAAHDRKRGPPADRGGSMVALVGVGTAVCCW